MSADDLAIVRIRQELERSSKGGSLSISSLSIKVKWGQGSLTNLGTCRAFLQRHPEVFTIQEGSVSLLKKEVYDPAVGSNDSEAKPLHQPNVGSAAPKVKRRRFDDEDPIVAVSSSSISGMPPTPEGTREPAKLESSPSSPPPPPPITTPAAPRAQVGAAAASVPLPPQLPKEPAPPPPKFSGLEVGQSPASSSRSTLPGGSSPSPEAPRVSSEPPKVVATALAPKSLPSSSMVNVARSWTDDSLNNDALSEKIAESKLLGIELELELLLERAGLTALCEDDSESSQSKEGDSSSVSGRILDNITSEAEEPGKGLEVGVEVIGAHHQGTAVKDSDFDVLVTVKKDVALSEKQTFVRKLREGLETCPGLKVTEAKHRCPGLGIASFSVEFVWREPTTTAHVFLATKPEAQVSRGLDASIKKLCDSWPRSRTFAGLVKLWAGSHNLVFDSDLNGTAWTMIALYYLQKDGYMASLSLLNSEQKEKEPHKPSSEFPGWAKLFQGFLAFLADIPASTELSLTLGSQRIVTSGRAPLLLEDPTPQDEAEPGPKKNLIAGLKKVRWAQVMSEARQCSERLDRKPLRWFHWIELFDPEDQPVKRIGSLKDAVSQLGHINYGQIPPEYYLPRPPAPPVLSMPVPPPPPPGKGHGQGGYQPQKRQPILGASQIYGNRS